ncbi:MAG: helix-turn-helix domain-containing protein [Defluviitaleaceae bacterium]|nr:helix-turn-helix domain-containing protein [Defluviitaleaceae bacterium]
MLKHQLIDEALAMKGNQDLVKNKEIRVKFEDYLKTHGNDPLVEDGLRLLDAWAAEFHKSNLEVSSEIAAPVFDRLSKTDDWNFYDLRIMAAIVNYAKTFTQVRVFAEKALKKLEEHSHEERYTRIKLVIHVNAIYRMLRAKYFESDNLVASDELESMFSSYTKEVMAICGKDQFPIHKAVTMIRMGLFNRDNELTTKGFIMLKETGADEVYRMTKEDAEEFDFFADLNVSKKQLSIKIGENIRKKRREFGLTLEDVSRALEMTNANVGFMERGERGVTGYNLLKLSNLFGVPIDYFYTGVEAALPPEMARRRVQLRKLDGFVKHLNESQLDYIITMAKNLPDVVNTKP